MSFREEWEVLMEGSAERLQAERRAVITPEALDYLALLPVWTIGLAKYCAFTTSPHETVDVAVQQFRSLALCRWAPPAVDVEADDWEDEAADDGDRQRFWMDPGERREHLEWWIDTAGRPRPVELAATIAHRVIAAEQDGVAVLPIQVRWALLAAGGSDSSIARLLNEMTASPATSRQWVEAAEPLAQALGGVVSAAYRRGIDLLRSH